MPQLPLVASFCIHMCESLESGHRSRIAQLNIKGGTHCVSRNVSMLEELYHIVAICLSDCQSAHQKCKTMADCDSLSRASASVSRHCKCNVCLLPLLTRACVDNYVL
jgi:hypothetical protein